MWCDWICVSVRHSSSWIGVDFRKHQRRGGDKAISLRTAGWHPRLPQWLGSGKEVKGFERCVGSVVEGLGCFFVYSVIYLVNDREHLAHPYVSAVYGVQAVNTRLKKIYNIFLIITRVISSYYKGGGENRQGEEGSVGVTFESET